MELELEYLLNARPAPPRLPRKVVASLLDVSEGALRHWEKRRPKTFHPPPCERVGGRIFYPTSDLIEFIATWRKRPYPRRKS